MLKQIKVEELRIGMHLHELCGSWVDHPFWKTKFVLRDPADMVKLRESGLTDCWIDSSKGLDVVEPKASTNAVVQTIPIASGPETPLRLAPIASAKAPAHNARIEDELGRAAALVTQSRQAVMSLYQEARMGRAVDAQQCLPLVADIAGSVWRNPGALVSLARLKTHDDYSYMHSVAVCALMVSLARQLGQNEALSREAGLAGLLHDLGKATMPIALLNKPGKLTEAEFEVIKSHPKRGHDLLSEGSDVPAAALDVCLHHHERADGKGYPEGLNTEELSVVAKMGSVCDVYDAITSNRPYKASWDPADSLARMSQWSKGGQFDLAIYASFLKSLGVYPVGSLVRMQSGRLGVVVDQNPHQILKPRVKVFFSTRAQLPVPVEVLDTASSACNDRIIGRESNAHWKFQHLDELWAGRETLVKTGRQG